MGLGLTRKHQSRFRCHLSLCLHLGAMSFADRRVTAYFVGSSAAQTNAHSVPKPVYLALVVLSEPARNCSGIEGQVAGAHPPQNPDHRS